MLLGWKALIGDLTDNGFCVERCDWVMLTVYSSDGWSLRFSIPIMDGVLAEFTVL